VLVTAHAQHRLIIASNRRLSEAQLVVGDSGVSDTPLRAGNDYLLDDALRHLNEARMDDRSPVLAVGSNASPAQMRHKYQGGVASLVIPMVQAEVRGLAVGVAADPTPVGYVPATPIVGPDLESTLFVQWLDPRQLAALDATETGYRRVLVPAGQPDRGGVRIELPSGEVLDACYAYVSLRGCLTAGTHRRRLGDQATLLADLLARSTRLSELLGPTPESWTQRIKDPAAVAEARRILRDEGWVAPPDALGRMAQAEPDDAEHSA
jgi:hypothetical protein